MGKLIYGVTSTSFDIEDRTLAHLRIVISTKLRRGEPFLFDVDLGDGTGHRSLWLHPAVPLQFHFHGSRAPRINRAWIDDLMQSANSLSGLVITPEPPEARADEERTGERS